MTNSFKINVITTQPDIFDSHLAHKPFNKALDLKIISLNIINLRDFPLDTYGTIDDKPYGGGVGMILRPEPIHNALKSIYKDGVSKNLNGNKTVVLSPTGKKWTSQLAKEYSKLDSITLICGRYEGIDHRVQTQLADESISIGDYVLSGGELPALVIMESIIRLLPGVINKEEATQLESFSNLMELEHPQYTRPEEFLGQKVPEILLSGDHEKIRKWKRQNSKSL